MSSGPRELNRSSKHGALALQRWRLRPLSCGRARRLLFAGCASWLSIALVVVLAAVPLAAPAQAGPSPTVVTVRVEGATSTLFEGPVFTDGHAVTTASGGTQHCDGTNNGANPSPGPAATAALDDAAELGGFTWDGTFFPAFDDYLVTRVGPDTQTSTAFWGIVRNFQLTPTGGCQQRVGLGDQLVFAFDAFSKSHFLRLTGPKVTLVGQPITVTVTDGATGLPLAGATVNGATTGPDGEAGVTFDHVGVKRLKAERSDSIRSNALYVFVPF